MKVYIKTALCPSPYTRAHISQPLLQHTIVFQLNSWVPFIVLLSLGQKETYQNALVLLMVEEYLIWYMWLVITYPHVTSLLLGDISSSFKHLLSHHCKAQLSVRIGHRYKLKYRNTP